MRNKSLEILPEDAYQGYLEFMACKTDEDFQKLMAKQELLNESSSYICQNFDMDVEEFKKKYGYVSINDLKGKYGF